MPAQDGKVSHATDVPDLRKVEGTPLVYVENDIFHSPINEFAGICISIHVRNGILQAKSKRSPRTSKGVTLSNRGEGSSAVASPVDDMFPTLRFGKFTIELSPIWTKRKSRKAAICGTVV